MDDDLSPGTEVTLRRAPEWRGVTVGKTLNGVVHIAFVGGGSGNFAVSDLVVLDGADKQWPPAVETKSVQA